ncbi:hypothetical protein DFH08DRAFT_814031 [Mycena albidolilacea]|uniref:Uncharacterized protein n=1 Tax=Mycena albidolilacea TaxID=1033008 RepID=A0AAD6ZPR6_9AGAR|nr:hypothetical protein DFH08DRAFT_814031 [Mycena albidolilacea]
MSICQFVKFNLNHPAYRTILLNEANEALQTAKYQAQSDHSQLAKQRIETKRQQVGDAEKVLALAKAEANSNSSGRVLLPRAQTRTATATVFPATTAVSIPSAGTPDSLQPIAAGEPSEAPIRQLRKRARAHSSSAPSLQPGKAPKRAKKGGGKELNLDWELVAGGKRWWARDLARDNPEEFKLEWPAYAHLVDIDNLYELRMSSQSQLEVQEGGTMLEDCRRLLYRPVQERYVRQLVPVARQERVVCGGFDPFVEYETTEHWQALRNEMLSRAAENCRGVPLEKVINEFHFSDRSTVKCMKGVGSLGLLGLTRNPDISVSVAPAVLAKVSNASHISGTSPESEMNLTS